MTWDVECLEEAYKDLQKADGSQRILVLKTIKKVQQNHQHTNENGYGEPLGNHNNAKLSGLLKIKLRNAGIRIVYKLLKVDSKMLIVVIGIREDEEVYNIASFRAIKHNL